MAIVMTTVPFPFGSLSFNWREELMLIRATMSLCHFYLVGDTRSFNVKVGAGLRA